MSDKITIDPEFHGLIPSLSDEEKRQLEENIVIEKGCRDVLVTWRGLLLDGHNRHEICERLGLPYKTAEIDLSDREEAVAWIARNQLGRRNLKESQRAMLAARLTDLKRERGRPKRNAEISAIKSRDDAAKGKNVSSDSVGFARKVLTTGIPALQKAVTDGEVAVSAAAAIAELPKEEQRELVKAGPSAVKEKAADLRHERQGRVNGNNVLAAYRPGEDNDNLPPVADGSFDEDAKKSPELRATKLLNPISGVVVALHDYGIVKELRGCTLDVRSRVAKQVRSLVNSLNEMLSELENPDEASENETRGTRRKVS